MRKSLSDGVDFEVDGHVAVIIINRPEARNAVNAAIAMGIESGIDLIEDDEVLWIGIITGVPPAFSAGADLKEINVNGGPGKIITERGGFAGIAQRNRTKPMIAAVDGFALAGGTEIVLACDLVVASENANFGLPEVKRGLVASGGGLMRLPRKIPHNIAMEVALTGEPISAKRAWEFGLVNLLVPSGEALMTAKTLAHRIAGNAPVAVRETRRVLIDAGRSDELTGWTISEEAMDRVVNSEDFREGLAAFIEKRPPVWKGR